MATYNEIVELIKGSAEGVNASGTFIHGRRSDGSIIYDKPYPQIHLYPFVTTVDRIDNNDSSDILMGFWFPDSADSSPEQMQEIIAKADDLCREFIDDLIADGTAQVLNVRTEPQYKTLAGTLSGYAVRFTLLTKNDC